jgi:hypothetical protein
MDTKWNAVYDVLPPDGQRVETKIDDENGCRNVQPLTRNGRLWYASDSNYVYYTPTHWRTLP